MRIAICSFRPWVQTLLLDLNELATGRIPAISPALGISLAEAAGVCLESQGHSSDVELQVLGFINGTFSLSWPQITEQARRAWNDDRTATEWGAAGVAALLVDRNLPHTPIEVSRQGTGFDFWLGSESDSPFEATAILEVSGVRRGNSSVVGRRVREKLRQVEKSLNLGLATYIVVIEFGTPLAEVHQS